MDSGCHRFVVLVGPVAVKVPVMRYGFDWWLRGWLASRGEVEEWCLTRDVRLCPILISAFGLVVVMRRCETEPEVSQEEVDVAIADYSGRHQGGPPAEPYPKSYGRLDGRVVAFDYGRWK